MKQVERMAKTQPEVSGQDVGGWLDSRELLADIHRSYVQFRDGRVDPEHARVMVSHFKAAAAIMTTELEHARLTKRLIEKSAVLPRLELK